jgi:hypothetical protein
VSRRPGEAPAPGATGTGRYAQHMRVMATIGRGIVHVLTVAARVLGGIGGGGVSGARSVDDTTYRSLLSSRRDEYRP